MTSNDEQMLALMSRLRVGFGYDIHRFEWGLPLKLGGVAIRHDAGLASHTDGDAVCHAVIDALLTACGDSDIGTHYPPSDKKLKGADSLGLLADTVARLRKGPLDRVLNLTVTVLTEEPKLGSYRSAMVAALSRALGVGPEQVALAAGTNEKFDAVGSGEALVCFVQLLLLVKTSSGGFSAADNTWSSSGVAPDPRSAGGTEAAATQDKGGFTAAHTGTGHTDSHLPPRVQEFERAVKTKLPPLPKAPPPEPGDTLILYTDGASRGNPGPAASGWVLFNAQGFLVHEQGTKLGRMSNNEAEYAALLEALAWIERNLGSRFTLLLRLDSELVVKQLKGEYKVKAPHLQPTWLLAINAVAAFDDVEIAHVPRAENVRADALANMALDAKD